MRNTCMHRSLCDTGSLRYHLNVCILNCRIPDVTKLSINAQVMPLSKPRWVFLSLSFSIHTAMLLLLNSTSRKIGAICH